MSITRTQVILDCDPGIDDALAILLALASPEIDLIGITTVGGNSLVENETRNALAVLALGGSPKIPVAQGCTRGLIKDLTTAADTHGLCGLGYAELPQPTAQPIDTHAVDFLIETILAKSGGVTLVATGPLTNVALAIRKEPRVAKAVRDCIIMGGAFRHEGNMPLRSEYNVWCDPHAAHIVYHSGLPITLVPLDVTYRCLFTNGHMQRLASYILRRSDVVDFIDDATRFYIEYHLREQNIVGCAINDALAMALVFAPDLVKTQPLFVDVELGDGAGHAGTYADFWKLSGHTPNMRVALEVDAPRFMDVFVERMVALCARTGN